MDNLGNTNANIREGNRSEIRRLMVKYPGIMTKEIAQINPLGVETIRQHMNAIRDEWNGAYRMDVAGKRALPDKR